MPLVTMKELLTAAQKGKYAVGAFEFWSLDSAQAIISAAEEVGMPVILQAGPDECKYAGIENLADIALKLSAKSPVKIALHLDHGDTLELVEDALRFGFTSVMIDASALSFEENVQATKKAVEMAQKTGATVESELGRLFGDEGNITVSADEVFYTDPEQAALFVELTGIDALAIAIGSAHGFYKKEPHLDIKRLTEIASRVAVPLVLHGGTGIENDMIRQSIEHGIAKINICTEFVAAFGKTYTETQSVPGFKYGVLSLYKPSMLAGQAVAAEKIRLFAGDQAGKE